MIPVIDTRAQAVSNVGSAAAGDRELGSITLPAGGPWTIAGIWGQVVQASMAAAECAGGYIRIETQSGDITPNPAPGKFPTGYAGSSLGATIDVACAPLFIHSVDWEAAGKAVVKLYLNQNIAITTANQVVAGIIYGKGRTEVKPARFMDVVHTVKLAAAKSAIGTITLSEKAEEIVGLCFQIAHDGVLVAGEELLGYGTIESDDLDLVPGEYPANMAFSAGLGALINNTSYTPPSLIPVSIPVLGGSRIDCSFIYNTALTNAGLVSCYIAYR